MNHFRETVLLMLLVALSGCNSSADSGDSANVDSLRPDVPEWHDRFDMPWEIAPAEVPFTDPAVRKKFLRADKAVRKFVDASWFKQADVAYPYLGWNSDSPGGYNRTYQAKWEKSEREDDGLTEKLKHSIILSTTLHNKPRTANHFGLGATRKEIDGWTTMTGYSCGHARPVFHLTFQHSQFSLFADDSRHGARRPYGWAPGSAYFSARRRDEHYRYKFFVRSRGPGTAGSIHHSDNEDFLRYLQSAESFREAAEAEVDRLEQRVREYFASDEAGELSTHGGPTGADVPQPVPRPAEFPNPAIKEDVLKDALRDIARRRQLLAEHYEAMYASLIATFPGLAEIIADQPVE